MTEQESTHKEKIPKRQRRSKFWPIVGLLLLILIAFAGYKAWCYWQAMQQAQQQATASIQTLQQQVMELQVQTEQQRQALVKAQTQLHNLDNTPETLLVWRLYAASYSVYLAQVVQTVDHTGQDSLQLLSYADALMRTSRDPRIIPLQKALQVAVDTLRQQSGVPLAQLLQRISRISQRIHTLPVGPVATSASQTENAKPCAALSQQEDGWRQHWQRSVCELKRVIVVRHWQEPVKPLLAPGQRMFVEQNLQVLFEEMKFAARRGDTALYQQTVAQSRELIQRYFAKEAPVTQAVLMELSQLQQQSVSMPAIDLTSVHQALKQLQQQLSA